jgi:secreted trypsin-like serine protease
LQYKYFFFLIYWWKSIKHEDYDSKNYLNDIAILKLKREVSLNTNIQIACLPPSQSSSYPAFNQSSWTVGWGTESEDGGLDNLSNVLKNVKLTIYPSSFCENVLSTITKNWNSQICSGEMAGGKDSCKGDSGGALFQK